jgi:hypothetical protein
VRLEKKKGYEIKRKKKKREEKKEGNGRPEYEMEYLS